MVSTLSRSELLWLRLRADALHVRRYAGRCEADGTFRAESRRTGRSHDLTGAHVQLVGVQWSPGLESSPIQKSTLRPPKALARFEFDARLLSNHERECND